MNKKQKNVIIGCVYEHPKHEVNDFTNKHIMPLLQKRFNENMDIVISCDFNINLINYNDDKKSSNFLDTMFIQLSLPYIALHPVELRETQKY